MSFRAYRKQYFIQIGNPIPDLYKILSFKMNRNKSHDRQHGHDLYGPMPDATFGVGRTNLTFGKLNIAKVFHQIRSFFVWDGSASFTDPVELSHVYSSFAKLIVCNQRWFSVIFLRQSSLSHACFVSDLYKPLRTEIEIFN